MKQIIGAHKFLFVSLLAVATLSTGALDRSVSAADTPSPGSGSLVPLPLQLPEPSYKGTPSDLPSGPGIEPLSDKPRAPFLAPPGVKNLALHQKVLLNDPTPFSGEPPMVTDGQKEALDDQVVEMRKGTR